MRRHLNRAVLLLVVLSLLALPLYQGLRTQLSLWDETAGCGGSVMSGGSAMSSNREGKPEELSDTSARALTLHTTERTRQITPFFLCVIFALLAAQAGLAAYYRSRLLRRTGGCDSTSVILRYRYLQDGKK